MSLLRIIREKASDAAYTRGVGLARRGLVQGVSHQDDEIILRVAEPNLRSPWTVHIWPLEPDWSCDCPLKTNVCPHVIACVISLEQAKKAEGEDALPKIGEAPPPPPAAAVPVLPEGPPPRARMAQMAYRFFRDPAGLRVDRVLLVEGDEILYTGDLLARESRQAGISVLTNDFDISAEQRIRGRWSTVIPRELMGVLVEILGGHGDLRLDGEPVTASAQPVVPHGLVEDDLDPNNPQGFKLRLVRDPAITEVFKNGVVRCGNTLRPIGKGELSQTQRDTLTKGVAYRVDEVRKLVAEALPSLREKMPVLVRTQRLPDSLDSRPRLVLETRCTGEQLTVKPVILYGEPPTARVERGELEVIGATVPVRNRRFEDRLIREAAEYGLAVGIERIYNGESAVVFVDTLNQFPGDVEGDGWTRFRRAAAIQPKVTIEGDHLDLDFAGADPKRLMAAWLTGAKMVRVNEGWAPLPTGWLEQHGHLVADLLEARDSTGRVPKHALFDLARLAKELDQPPPPALDGLLSLVDDFNGIPEARLPKDLTATLRHYQIQGVNWLSFLKRTGMGGVLADDMGLGKTLQTLCILEKRPRRPKEAKEPKEGEFKEAGSLVVCPTSVIHNWFIEAQKFRPELVVKVYHGLQRELDEKADVLITTYGLLRLDIDKLRKYRWKIAILDEAQAIKNPESQVAAAAFRLEAEFRLTLTGTPVENRLEELWSQFHFVNRGLLGGRRDFRERYEKPISLGEPGSAARLRERIKPFVLRRMKEEVAPELPPRTDMVLRCTLSKEERAIYDAIRAATYDEVVAQLGRGNVLAALEALLRLRQASCHTGLIPGREDIDRSSKVELLIETLEEVVAEGHKALVFSQWTSLLDRVEPHLKKAGLGFVRLDGSTRDRQAVVERFQDKEGPPVFLISLKAGGTGLNLTAADHVFLLDPWWNPAVEDQAADRAHRIGQDKPVMLYRLVAEDTVEERILALQDRKRALADAALGEADQASTITRDELLALLS
jgi:superfamily II DNA or RNA helicase